MNNEISRKIPISEHMYRRELDITRLQEVIEELVKRIEELERKVKVNE